MTDYNAIIIGGGHNGLVASCLLAKQGFKTLVLEKNSFVGGLSATVEFFPGYKFSVGAHVFAMFRKKLRDYLELDRFGFETLNTDPRSFTPFPSGKYLMWWQNDFQKTLDDVKIQFSGKDAEGLKKYTDYWRNFAAGIGETFYNPPLSMGKLFSLFSGDEAEEAARQAFFIPENEFLDDLIDAEELKGSFAWWGCDSFFGGPRTPGTNLMAGIHFSAGEDYCFVKGGMGGLSEALARILKHHQGTLRLESPVKSVIIEKGKAIGVELENGEKILSEIVLSTLDPKTTFLKKVGPENLPDDFIHKINRIKTRTVHIQAFCALKELPDYTCLPGTDKDLPQHRAAHVIFAPSIDYVQKTWDEGQYGIPSTHPTVMMSVPSVYDPGMAPPGHHAASLYIQFMPHDLKGEDMEQAKQALFDRAVNFITEFAPNFKNSIINSKVLSSRDYETLFGTTDGHLSHGETSLSQLFSYRPVTGWSQYKTPVKNLYLAGAGAHPGGGVTGAPGHNAVQVVLEDWKGRKKK